jgi:hexokinase
LFLPNTPYDAELNEFSVNPCNKMFEKRVSGMFLSKLLRITILAMHTDPELRLFYDHDSSAATTVDERSPLHTRWVVDSSILSIAEADNSGDLIILRQKIEESLGIPAVSISVEEAQAVKVIAHAIGKRAARLAGMAVGAVILQSQRLIDPVDPMTVGREMLTSITRLSRDESGRNIRSDDIIKDANAVTTE